MKNYEKLFKNNRTDPFLTVITGSKINFKNDIHEKQTDKLSNKYQFSTWR